MTRLTLAVLPTAFRSRSCSSVVSDGTLDGMDDGSSGDCDSDPDSDSTCCWFVLVSTVVAALVSMGEADAPRAKAIEAGGSSGVSIRATMTGVVTAVTLQSR